MHDLAPPLVALPCKATPGFSRQLSLTLLSQSRESVAVGHLALTLLYASWQAPAPASLARYCMVLAELRQTDGLRLLEALAHPLMYCTGEGAPDAQALAAHTAAQGWAARLAQKYSPDSFLTRHARLIGLLERAAALEHSVFPGEPLPALLEQVQSLVCAFDMRAAATVSKAPPTPALEAPSGLAALEYLMGLRLERARVVESPTGATPRASHLPRVAVYDPLAVAVALDRLPTPAPHEGPSHQRQLLEALAKTTGYKPLSEVPLGAPLDEMYVRFPHFKQPLDFVARSLALAACGAGGRPALIPAMLLRGPPGTGKTYFAQELARVLGAVYLSRDLSVTSEAFVLAGLDAGWKNSRHGLVFEALAHGATANPLICLDEVDKCRSGTSQGSPLAPMYALLEPNSAQRFVDEFATVALDARCVSWVLTANDGHIPAPILSRLEIFDIAEPTAEQCRAIAQSVWADAVRQSLPSGHGFPDTLTTEMLDCVTALSPRLMRKALLYAASSAALQGHRQLGAPELTQGVAHYARGHASRSIGFCAEL